MKIMWTICLKIILIVSCHSFGQFHNWKHYNRPSVESNESDNTVLRTYRRCMWEQSRFLPRRLVLLSLCSNLFCENNHIPRSSCLDILPEQCEQGDEEELMYKPFPDCCPVYCNLKRRMQRLRNMHYRHRMLIDKQRQQDISGTNLLLQEYGYNNF